jgi:anti-anti-sigma factor
VIGVTGGGLEPRANNLRTKRAPDACLCCTSGAANRLRLSKSAGSGAGQGTLHVLTSVPSEENASVEWRGNVVVLAIRHDIDLSNADELDTRLREPLREVASGFIVDFTHARFVDSSGLRVLFEFAATLRREGRPLAFVIPAANPLRRLLELSGAQELATFHLDVDAAVASMN